MTYYGTIPAVTYLATSTEENAHTPAQPLFSVRVRIGNLNNSLSPTIHRHSPLLALSYGDVRQELRTADRFPRLRENVGWHPRCPRGEKVYADGRIPHDTWKTLLVGIIGCSTATIAFLHHMPCRETSLAAVKGCHDQTDTQRTTAAICNIRPNASPHNKRRTLSREGWGRPIPQRVDNSATLVLIEQGGNAPKLQGRHRKTHHKASFKNTPLSCTD